MKIKNKEILKLLFFSIATSIVVRYISIFVILEGMKITNNDFHKNLITLNTYQQKTVENLYLQIVTLFVLPYIAAILFYFFIKINLRPKNNFLVFISAFTLLFFSSFILIGYSYKFLK